MSDKIHVEVTLTFDVDPQKWQDTYGETIAPTDAGDLIMYFDGVQVSDLVPASAEWVADGDAPTVTVRVNGQ